MKKPGRKGFGEELKIIERYSDLSEPFFVFLKEKLENGTDEEKWNAAKILKGAFEKMIPQDMNVPGVVRVIVAKEAADKYEGDNVSST